MLQELIPEVNFAVSKMHDHAHNPKSDVLGIISSSLCLIHCLAGPVLVLAGVGFMEPDNWHLWDLLFLAVSVWAVYNATKGHSQRWIKTGLWVSLGVLSVSIFFSHEILIFNVISWIAAISLVLFHYFNLRHIRNCRVKS